MPLYLRDPGRLFHFHNLLRYLLWEKAKARRQGQEGFKPLLQRIGFISYQSECVVWKSKHREVKLGPIIVVHHGGVQTGGGGAEGGGLHLVAAGPGLQGATSLAEARLGTRLEL